MNLPTKKQRICEGISKVRSDLHNIYIGDIMNSGYVLSDTYETKKSILLKFGVLDLAVSHESKLIRTCLPYL